MRTRFLLTPLAAVLLAAPAALACKDHDRAAKTAATAATAATVPANHDGAVTARAGAPGKDCCAGKAKADCAAHQAAGKAGCPFAKAATVQAKSGGADHKGADCHGHAPGAVTAGAATNGTPVLAATLPRAAATAPARLDARGKVLCARCDLKTAAACQSRFRPAGDTASYRLCDEEVTQQLLKLTRHGELDVTVHGRLSSDESGEEVLCLDGFSVGTI